VDTVQTNVRVAESDKPLIIQVAARLRSDAEFRCRLAALLEDQAGAALAERIKALEQQVSWLLSGAIVVPRSATRAVQPPPPALSRLPAKAPPSLGPMRAGGGHD
jgi:hypothetical protein